MDGERKVEHGLDGVFFRIKRGDKYTNVCFSDMTKEERQWVYDNKDKQWICSLCDILANTIYNIAEQFHIFSDGYAPDEGE